MIVPNQPSRPGATLGEVTLDFQAFILESLPARGRLWIHSKIKACMEAVDCIAVSPLIAVNYQL